MCIHELISKHLLLDWYTDKLTNCVWILSISLFAYLHLFLYIKLTKQICKTWRYFRSKNFLNKNQKVCEYNTCIDFLTITLFTHLFSKGTVLLLLLLFTNWYTNGWKKRSFCIKLISFFQIQFLWKQRKSWTKTLLFNNFVQLFWHSEFAFQLCVKICTHFYVQGAFVCNCISLISSQYELQTMPHDMYTRAI